MQVSQSSKQLLAWCDVYNACILTTIISRNHSWQDASRGKLIFYYIPSKPVLCPLKAHLQNCELRLLPSCLSVRPHGTARLPLDRFSWNLIFEDFSKTLLKHVERLTEINKLRNFASCWLYCVEMFLDLFAFVRVMVLMVGRTEYLFSRMH